MRLFFALEFDSETKDYLTALQEDLVSYCPKGLFTRSINLHLTLCFLGEVEGQFLPILKEILFSLEAKPLLCTFNQLGLFRKRKGDILWLGIEENKELETLQKELAYKLKANTFLLDNQDFHPHVTLAHGVKCKKLPAIEGFKVPCEKISLMHSHQKQAILTYTPLFSKHLEYTTPLQKGILHDLLDTPIHT
ncbi:MAG: RNA 2',3'-cyclic phosphodiesterase [Sphaerochaeta sp.]|nr:RNA 2',3'-cyclic phosphodiesterase [Sphaerochaeta sp.]